MNLFNLRRSAPAAAAEPKRAPVIVPHASELSPERLMPGAERAAQVFVRGQGSWLWDNEGHAYLDFTQGGAVNSLGHSPSVLVKALGNQAQALINPGSGFHNRGLLGLVNRLCQSTGSDQAYLLNSGAEACEGAIKLARKWGQLHRNGAITSLLPAKPAMAVASARCPRPTRCRAIAANLACRVSARCRSMTSRRCTPRWIHAPWQSCSSRYRVRRALFPLLRNTSRAWKRSAVNWASC